MTSAGYESYTLRPGPIVLSAVALSVVTVLAFVLMNELKDSFEAQAVAVERPQHELASTRELPPAPRLQARPAEEIARFRATVAAQSSEYGWIDAQAGVVRIPIERALELTVERGLPSFGEGER